MPRPLLRLAPAIIGLALSACGGGGSDSSSVNGAPTAVITVSTNVGSDLVSGYKEMALGQTLTLSAPASLVLDYEWQLLASPAGMTRALNEKDDHTVSITPDIPGDYLIQLQADDAQGRSAKSTFRITVTNATCSTTDCVKSLFSDDPVGGLNFACGYVRGITDDDGVFDCPKNTVVTFYLQANHGTRRITLGQTRTTLPSALSSRASPDRITAFDLVPGGRDLDQLGNDEASTRIEHLVRLLLTFGSTSSASGGRIRITESGKAFIDLLATHIGPEDFSGDFNTTFAPLLTALGARGYAAPSVSVTRDRLTKIRRQSLAGVFETARLPILDSLMVGMRSGDNMTSLVQSLLLVDRAGKAIGFGAEWQGTIHPQDPLDEIHTPTDLMYYRAPLNWLDLAGSESAFRDNGIVKTDTRFDATSIATGQTAGSVRWRQGRLLFNKGLAGGSQLYRMMLGMSTADIVPDADLGRWERLDDTGGPTFSGSMTLFSDVADAFWLDPALWKSAGTITPTDTERRPVFPLHLELSLRDNNLTACPGTGCDAGKIGITLMADGNILSDRNHDCSATDGSLTDGSGAREYRLGMVGSILRENGRTLITPILLVPRIPGWERQYGLTLGVVTAAGGSKAILDISDALSKSVSLYKRPASPSEAVMPAPWSNYLKFYQSLGISDPNARAQGLQDSLGIVSSVATTACYNPPALPL